MPTTQLPLYKVGALALTRAALGVGIGLLVAERLEPRPRTAIALTLIGVGVASTIPLVVSIIQGVDPRAAGPAPA